jgi:uncharacterized protein (UPF0335 family)
MNKNFSTLIFNLFQIKDDIKKIYEDHSNKFFDSNKIKFVSTRSVFKIKRY